MTLKQDLMFLDWWSYCKKWKVSHNRQSLCVSPGIWCIFFRYVHQFLITQLGALDNLPSEIPDVILPLIQWVCLLMSYLSLVERYEHTVDLHCMQIRFCQQCFTCSCRFVLQMGTRFTCITVLVGNTKLWRLVTWIITSLLIIEWVLWGHCKGKLGDI